MDGKRSVVDTQDLEMTGREIFRVASFDQVSWAELSTVEILMMRALQRGVESGVLFINSRRIVNTVE
jgi:hypothetical protein